MLLTKILLYQENDIIKFEKCISYLNIFLEKTSIDDFDKAAEDLRLATRYLGRVVGDVDVEESLEKFLMIFV